MDFTQVDAGKPGMIQGNRPVDQPNHDLRPTTRTCHEAIQLDQFQRSHKESARSLAMRPVDGSGWQFGPPREAVRHKENPPAHAMFGWARRSVKRIDRWSEFTLLDRAQSIFWGSISAVPGLSHCGVSNRSTAPA